MIRVADCVRLSIPTPKGVDLRGVVIRVRKNQNKAIVYAVQWSRNGQDEGTGHHYEHVLIKIEEPNNILKKMLENK